MRRDPEWGAALSSNQYGQQTDSHAIAGQIPTVGAVGLAVNALSPKDS